MSYRLSRTDVAQKREPLCRALGRLLPLVREERRNIAIALGAEALLFFTDTPGLLRDRDDESSLIREIDASDPASALAAAKGRMVVKVEAAIGAINRGVGRVVFADARVEAPITRALAGAGTVIA